MGNTASFVTTVLAVSQLLGDTMSEFNDKLNELEQTTNWLLTVTEVAFDEVLAPWIALDPFRHVQRDEKHRHTMLGGTWIKLGVYSMGIGLPDPVVGKWKVIAATPAKGEVWFAWHQAPMYGCKMTGVFLNTKNDLYFPPLNEQGEYPWYPNGTLFGETGDCKDSDGTFIDGHWTANLTDKDRNALAIGSEFKITITENPDRSYKSGSDPNYYIPDRDRKLFADAGEKAIVNGCSGSDCHWKDWWKVHGPPR